MYKGSSRSLNSPGILRGHPGICPTGKWGKIIHSPIMKAFSALIGC